MSTFDKYCDECRALLRKIEGLFQEEQDAAKLLKECEELLPRMTVETRLLDDEIDQRAQMDIVNAYTMQIESYWRQNDRQALIRRAPEESKVKSSSSQSLSHRDRMLQQQKMLQRQNTRLENARQTMAETEILGGVISKELAKNRETLERTSGNVQQLRDMAGNAKTMVTNMAKKWF